MADNEMEMNAGMTEADEMENMYLDFSVGGEIYGIEIRYVIQIIGMQEITEMPEMPYAMKGFINLRGNVIPVVSMRLRFGKYEEVYTDRTCIVVVQVGDKDIGLIVDSIEETIRIEPDQISPPPKRDADSYITGIARLSGNRTAMLMQLNKLFVGQNF